ncbi:hypothetical protein ACFL6Q_07040 [Candidatus Neomarinimicrobiota bacterium]
MKQITVWASSLVLLMIVGLAAGQSAAGQPDCGECPGFESPPRGCTVFTVAIGEEVFFGGNDDYILTDGYYWVDPGNGERYGAIWIGQPDNVQQGVNEVGLAYDANGLPRVDVNPHSERTPVEGGYSAYPIQILHECATVEEVIEWINNHEWHSYMHDQLQFADATGDAVIISAGADGELVFTRKVPGDGFLVSSNYNVANPANGTSYPCWRYDRASAELGRMVEEGRQLKFQDATDVLAAVHVDGGTSWTIESLVADLTRGVVYLYYFHQYDQPVVLNVAEELANPREPGPLSQLFPEDVRQEAQRRYEAIKAQGTRCNRVGMIWTAAVLASLVLLLGLSPTARRGWRLWVPAAIALGPLALLIWLAAGRSPQAGTARLALLEAAGDVMPSVVTFALIPVVLIFIPALQSSMLLQLVMILVPPLVAGWLLFQVPLLGTVSEGGAGRFLVQRLPHALVVVNLGMAGIMMIALPLVILSTKVCSLMPLKAWTVISWLAVAALGALVGGLLCFLYEYRSVKGGHRAWSVLALGDGTVSTPSWRKLWWLILLSIAVLLAGMVAVGVLIGLLTG